MKFRLVDTEDGPFRIRIQGARSQEPLGRTPPQVGTDEEDLLIGCWSNKELKAIIFERFGKK